MAFNSLQKRANHRNKIVLMDRIGGVSPTRSVVFLCAMQSREFSFSRLWMDAGLRPSALVGIDWDRNNPARSRENIAANRAEIPEGTWINQELGKALDSLVGKDGLIDAQCVDNDTWSLPTSRDALANSCLLYTSPSPRDQRGSRMPSSA